MQKMRVILLLIAVWMSIDGCSQLIKPHFIQNHGDIYLANELNTKFYTKKKILEIVSTIKTNNIQLIDDRGISINHPYDQAVFPRDIASPWFSWDDSQPGVGVWLIHIGFEGKDFSINTLSSKTRWIPDQKIWEIIKENAVTNNVQVTILGANRKAGYSVESKKSITISISKDAVGAPIVYQQMPLPILEGSKHPDQFRWLLADLSSYHEPRIILEKQRVCGMCHHFSQDGKIFGMDLDIGGDKGSYGLSRVSKHMEFTQDDFISWTKFQNDGETTLGLFSKISPDGNYVISTIKEKRIFITIDDLEFSELFFAFTGVLACYSIPDNRFFLLPGADDPDYVHLGPTWSPENRYIVFSRARAKNEFDIMGNQKFIKASKGMRIRELNKKYQLRYDLYRIPFNHGNGGTPEPLQGASHNGKSNYWPRYSPDGKWIVFVKSDNALMNQPGSQLYILPAQGGEPRKMTCSRKVHNSWHSWSPNGRWLVFSSKVNTPFTELFLAHVDENGNDSPPVLLFRLNSKYLASVLPEFANIQPDAIQKIIVKP
ncbi:TolB family protein [Thermodesulfobacteriota bacterium]